VSAPQVAADVIPAVIADAAVADEAEYVALAVGDVEIASADSFGCGCIPVLRGDEAKVPHPRPPGHFLAAEGVLAQASAPPPPAPVPMRRTASAPPSAAVPQLPLHVPVPAGLTASASKSAAVATRP
jgi:hypothetical protein